MFEHSTVLLALEPCAPLCRLTTSPARPSTVSFCHLLPCVPLAMQADSIPFVSEGGATVRMMHLYGWTAQKHLFGPSRCATLAC